ncbi:MAG: heparinase II/III family protein [Clostridia bacterium]|nr:heparinase II/III family protein [Clostridia bacterium]
MKNRIIAILVCIILFVGTVPLPFLAHAKASELVLNESFNQYMTNEVLYELDARSIAYYIREYRDGEKGIFLSTLKSGAGLSYKFTQTQNACVSFDVLSTGETLVGSFNLIDSKGTSLTALRFEKRHQITTSNGKHIGGYGKNNITNVAIVVDEKNACLNIYINGKLMAAKVKMLTKAITDVSSIGFSFDTAPEDDNNAGVIIDNINVHGGGKILDKYPVADFNPETAPPVDVKLEGNAAGGKVLDVNFDQQPSFTIAAKENIIERIAENETNMASLHERTNTSDFHTDVKGVSSLSDYVVYEYDIKILNIAETAMRVWLKDVNAKYSSMCIFQKNGNLTLGGFSTKLSGDRWYRISTVYNYFERTRDYYIDGKLVYENDPIEADLGTAADIDVFRFHVEAKSSVEGNRAKFLLDNIRVYETKEPVEDLSTLSRTVSIDRNLSVFDSEKKFENYLKGYTSLHTRSGVVIHNGKRHTLPTVPEGLGTDAMVVADEICSVIAVKCEISDNALTIDGKAVEPSKYKVKDGKTYINVNTLFEDILGKKVYSDSTTLSDGLVVAGDETFTPPSDEAELQLFNNYTFFVRPDEEAIKTAYENSPNKGEHPRIHATAADFERLRSEIKSGNKKELFNQIIERADEYVANDVAVKYELRDGTRLLDVCRDVLRNMYVLGMAYQLTGEQKYARRAWTDLEAVSNFPDWHPGHSLDPAEMSAAVSIGYDWMYEAFTPEQRSIIEKGIYNNLFYVTCNSLQSKKGLLSGGFTTNMNHNLIISSGISMGAMCFMDVYPEISSYILSNTIRAIGNAIYNYGPDGAWVEGPHYWEYSTQYTTKLLSSLDSAIGNDFRLSLVEGLSTAADFIMNLQSDIGIFNYGDGAVARQYVPEILWLAHKYNLDYVTPAWLELSGLSMNGYEDRVLALLWLDANVTKGEITMPTSAFYKGENVVTFRDKWTKENGTFVGIHGGQTIVNHSHLDGGSFVFDSMGVRWAQDPGSGPYDLPDCWDTVNGGRWKYYMTRAEAHNSLVINPDSEPDHNPFSKVTIDRFEEKPKGGIAVANTTELYLDDALSARRGFFFTDNRQSLVIRDEITLKKKSDVYWFMQTKADVTVTEDGAMLSYDGKRLKLEAVSDAKLEITSGESVPLPTSPVMKKDLMPGMNRIVIKFTASGDTAITVKLTPYGIGSSDVAEYHKSIDSWSVADGSIESFTPPELKGAYADSKPLNFNSGKTATIGIAGGKNAKYPLITADVDQSKYNIEIIDERELDFTAIKVTDKTNSLNTSTWIVSYKIVPEPMEFDGMVSLPVSSVTVSSEPQPENHVYNIFDSDLSTKWATKGENQWIILELAEESVADNLMIAFGSGDVRQTFFDISVSTDGVNYEKLYDGLSLGGTLNHEKHSLGGKKVKYIKLGFHGNTQAGRGGWTSVQEVVVTRNK